jgi:hypothetical protein
MRDVETGRRRAGRRQDELKRVGGERVAKTLPERDFGRVELRPGHEQDARQF